MDMNLHQGGIGRNSDDSEATLYDGNMSEKHVLKGLGDLESQLKLDTSKAGKSLAPLAMEYRVSARRKLTYLGGYFLLNLCLTLYNKALLGNVRLCH
jgi:hypothetical protein